MTESMLLFGNKSEYAVADGIYNAVTNGDNAELAANIGKIIEIADRYKIQGDIWRGFISWLILNDENAFSLSCEMSKPEGGSLYNIAMCDISALRKLFFLDFADYDERHSSALNILKNMRYSNDRRCMNLTEIGDLCVQLGEKLENTETDAEFLDACAEFYSRHGVGLFGLNKAFYLDTTDGLEFVPISDFDNVHLSDMWGYEIQKKQLTDNTEAFLDGHNANNVLLYGDSGTGKSTSVKAVLNEYHPRGLRMIEVYKHQFAMLPRLIEILRRRNYRFIIFMDDLSFEDFEIEYKFLKAVIEGGLEKRPDNVLIYATSNRRHLIRESFSERSGDDEVHKNDTMQEKLSLSDRFGVTINFSKPLQKEYFEIVKYLAKINEIDIDEDELVAKARMWGVRHGGISGRVAHQFISHLMGTLEEQNI